MGYLDLSVEISEQVKHKRDGICNVKKSNANWRQLTAIKDNPESGEMCLGKFQIILIRFEITAPVNNNTYLQLIAEGVLSYK